MPVARRKMLLPTLSSGHADCAAYPSVVIAWMSSCLAAERVAKLPRALVVSAMASSTPPPNDALAIAESPRLRRIAAAD